MHLGSGVSDHHDNARTSLDLDRLVGAQLTAVLAAFVLDFGLELNLAASVGVNCDLSGDHKSES